MVVLEFLRAKPKYALLATLVVSLEHAAVSAPPPVLASPAQTTQTNYLARWPKNTRQDQSASAGSNGFPALPRVAPGYRSDLRPVFTKSVPTSLADLRSMEQHVKALAARVAPTVVAVEVGTGSGSGVIISADGLVLTAGHVCGAPDREVRFTFPDGKKALGKTLGANADNDTGLMRITDRGQRPHAEMGDLREARIGDWVLALGHPGGFDARRSLVVRLGRIIRLEPDALQTDCTISPGDSGGPLFDMHGRVIGIHSAISSSVAENFHVPVTAFYQGWALLAKKPEGKIRADRPLAYVGAKGADDPDGCRLTAVDEDGPAARAGLKVGDLVVKVDGREVRLYASLLRWVAESEPGDTLSLEVKRGSDLLSLDVKLEALPAKRP
jgi:serine protease Do